MKLLCFALLLLTFQEPEDPPGPNDPTEEQLAIRSEAIGWKADMEFNKEMAEAMREDCHTKKQEAMDMYLLLDESWEILQWQLTKVERCVSDDSS